MCGDLNFGEYHRKPTLILEGRCKASASTLNGNGNQPDPAIDWSAPTAFHVTLPLPADGTNSCTLRMGRQGCSSTPPTYHQRVSVPVRSPTQTCAEGLLSPCLPTYKHTTSQCVLNCVLRRKPHCSQPLAQPAATQVPIHSMPFQPGCVCTHPNKRAAPSPAAG